MAGKYYAVRRGKTVGIFRSWEECRMQVMGYSGAEYKSFKKEEEACAYLNREANDANKGSTSHNNGIHPALYEAGDSTALIAYVDGSYNNVTKEFSYGMVVLKDGQELCFSQKVDEPELASMRNVAGEIKGAEAAMRYALATNYKKLVIYHDYEGISRWCLGDWKTNKEGTKAYKAFYDSIKDKVAIEFVKVTGHSNDKYNDMADELAKQALGLGGSTIKR